MENVRASSWRTWLYCLLVDNYCVFVEILAASSWRSWLPPCGDLGCLLVYNYCLLVENFSFWTVSDVTIGLLVFYIFQRTFYDLHRSYSWIVRRFCHLLDCATFLLYSGLCDVFVVLWIVLPTLRSDFYFISFYNDLRLPTLWSDFLVGHPLRGIILPIVFFCQYSCWCRFTMCRNSPLSHDRNRNSIK